MKLSIPQDWDGESWKCYKIYWPDSLDWKVLLNGMITTYLRGRTWNENTGSVLGAIAEGQALYDANNPLQECDAAEFCQEQLYILLTWLTCWRGNIDSIPVPLTDTFLESLNDCLDECCGGDDVPAITDIKCEDGWLWVQQCCTWRQVCELSSITGDSIPDDIPEPDPPPPSPTCYKAGAFSEHFVPWMEAIAALLAANPTWTNAEAVDGIKALYPANQWEWWSTINMIQVYRSYPATVQAMLDDPLFGSRYQCALYFILETNGIPADNEDWLLTFNDKALWNAYLGNTLEYDPHANSFASQFMYAIATAYAQTTVASYSGSVYDCSGCIEDELSPQSATTASGWFLTQGYYGDGPQSASGEPYNSVCCGDEPDFPYNCWGVAFRLISTNQPLTSGNVSLTSCTGVSIGGGGETMSAAGYYVRCHADIWSELSAVAEHAYSQSQDAHYDTANISLPPDLQNEDFALVFGGPYNEDLIGVEATDIRFICNMNNLTS